MVVDDNSDYRNVVSLLLRGDGLEVIEAGDGREGLKFAARRPPDLVLLDFNMPRMNGFELLQELRALDETRRVPVILFTGTPHRRQLREMGLDVVLFLDKPVANKDLLEHIRNVLRESLIREQPPAAAEAPPPLPEPATPPPADSEAIAPEAAEEPQDPFAEYQAPPIMTLPPIGAPAAPPVPSTPPPIPAPPMEALPEPDELVDSAELLETVDAEQEQKRLERERGVEAVAEDSPLVKRVHQLLVQAVARRASDIHIEPQEDRVVVRLRIDGTLTEICSLPASLHPRLATRIKIMANLVITEHRLPQDGQFRARIRGQKVEFRVSTLPSTYGEKIVLRALASGGLCPDLGRLGMAPRDKDEVERTLKSPHGLILVTGPTGSGKTSTLYSMLSALNRPGVNILTAEDPIEYRLPGITQVQMHPAIGLKFETAMRAFLRQDPDIMLVGEIRDRETAEIAVKAAITGHLVLSTLHTNSAPASVARLVHIGMPPFLIAASTRLIVAQRLVRRLCAGCRVPVPLSEEDRRALTEREAAELEVTQRGAGCPQCGGSGYFGRLPVFEVMPLKSTEFRETLQQSQDPDRIAEVAIREGMTPLRQAALRAVQAGETSLSEAYEVIFGE